MLNFISYTVSIFITLPLCASMLVYIVSMIIERNKWKAIQKLVNWTTLFYIIAVTIMLTLIFGMDFTGIVLITLLAILTCIIFIQWRTNRDVEIRRAVKLLWRISFLLFFVLYGCLMLVGILKQLVS